MNPVTFEVDLKVKGETEAEDKVLSLKIFEYDRPAAYGSNAYVTRNCCSSKRSTLGFKLATLLDTVEATVVSAKVVGGSWLDHFRGRVVCRTASASKEDIVLLDSRDGRMPITADGEIELSRSVVSVELTGQLISVWWLHRWVTKQMSLTKLWLFSHPRLEARVMVLVNWAFVSWKSLLPGPSSQPWKTCAFKTASE
jgi:hypothetical protein